MTLYKHLIWWVVLSDGRAHSYCETHDEALACQRIAEKHGNEDVRIEKHPEGRPLHPPVGSGVPR